MYNFRIIFHISYWMLILILGVSGSDVHETQASSSHPSSSSLIKAKQAPRSHRYEEDPWVQEKYKSDICDCHFNIQVIIHDDKLNTAKLSGKTDSNHMFWLAHQRKKQQQFVLRGTSRQKQWTVVCPEYIGEEDAFRLRFQMFPDYRLSGAAGQYLHLSKDHRNEEIHFNVHGMYLAPIKHQKFIVSGTKGKKRLYIVNTDYFNNDSPHHDATVKLERTIVNSADSRKFSDENNGITNEKSQDPTTNTWIFPQYGKVNFDHTNPEPSKYTLKKSLTLSTFTHNTPLRSTVHTFPSVSTSRPENDIITPSQGPRPETGAIRKTPRKSKKTFDSEQN